MPRYVLFHKPYGVLSQFTPEDGARSLAEFDLPSGIYPAGRLDKDSEGLLLLTDDGPLIEQLLNPRNAKPKTYWALVERVPDEAALQRLRSGLRIEDYQTRPCQAKILAPQPEVPPRTPPVRVRKTVQDVWLEITLVEGKNRQVRKMTAAIGHPTLRLIRYAIGEWTLDGLAPGESRALPAPELATAPRPAATQGKPRASAAAGGTGRSAPRTARPTDQDPPQGRDRRRTDPRPGNRSGGRTTARRPARTKPSE